MTFSLVNACDDFVDFLHWIGIQSELDPTSLHLKGYNRYIINRP
jgi:hypothetical protein